MRHARLMFLALGSSSLAALALGACSSTPAATPAADASTPDAVVVDAVAPDTSVVTDASVPDAAPDAAAPDAAPDAADATPPDAALPDAAAACGVAGGQVYDPVQAVIALANATTDVTVSANICPGSSLTFPYNEKRTLTLPRNTPFYFIATQVGNLPNLSQENNVKVAAFAKLPYGALLLPESFATGIDPTWTTATKALLRVVVNASTGAGACSAKDGVSYTVVGRADAIIKYAGGGTATGTSGDTWISLPTTGTLAAPEYVTITQTKVGCKVGPNGADQLFMTGRAPIAAGAITSLLGGEVTN